MSVRTPGLGTAYDRASARFARLTLHQFRYGLRAFMRNRQARFFTLILPVLFLVILASVVGAQASAVKVPGGVIDLSVFYVPGIIALGIISASFVNLTMSVITQRESGVLKRRRATPVPAAVIIVGRALSAVVISIAITVVLLVVGWVFYGARITSGAAPALVLTVVVGAVTFCCVAYALVSLIRNEDAAQPITQAVILPLYFISGVFVPISGLPSWLVDVADVFPVRHLAAALLVAYNPHRTGSAVDWHDLAILALWAVGAFVVAMLRFSWVPRGR